MNYTINSKLTLPITLLLVSFLMISCDNSTGTQPPQSNIQTYSVADLDASVPRGAPPSYTYFSLSQNKAVPATDSASTQWDIAFSGSSIIVNNTTSGPGQAGAIVLDLPFNEVTIAPSEGYFVDSDTSQAIVYTEWAQYTGSTAPMHAIIAKDNKTIVFETADGAHYAKIKIISWYQGNPDVTTDEFANLQTRPLGGYFTFTYAIQENGSRTFE